MIECNLILLDSCIFIIVCNEYNTPVIIKYPFWKMKAKNKHAVYGGINYQDVSCLVLIEKQSICIQEDICKAHQD